MQSSLHRVRVAVVDSGVNARHPHIGCVAGGVSVDAHGVIEEDSFIDRLGHGTAVMAAIQEKAPNAAYFAVRIFHDSLRTSSRALLRGLEWAVDRDVDVINLSLGTRNPAHADLFRPVIARANEAGIGVVAAFDCYPGLMAGVMGVDIDPDCDRDAYSLRGDVFLAAGYPRSAPGVPVERNLQGISFAVANVSGFAARIRQSVGRRELLATMRRSK